MDAYAYQAAMWCSDCAYDIIERLDKEGVEDNGDSGQYPQGPYSDGGGEADTPQHCDCCGEFLENPLTQEGYEYVLEQIENAPVCADRKVINEWIAEYGDDHFRNPPVTINGLFQAQD